MSRNLSRMMIYLGIFILSVFSSRGASAQTWVPQEGCTAFTADLCQREGELQSAIDQLKARPSTPETEVQINQLQSSLLIVNEAKAHDFANTNPNGYQSALANSNMALTSAGTYIAKLNASDKASRNGSALKSEKLDGTTPGSSSSTTDPEDSAEYDSSINSCKQAHNVAEECCAHPDRCYGKPDGKQTSSDGLVGGLIQMATGAFLSVPAGSMAAMCGKMKTVAEASTAANAYLAYQCTTYVSACKKACSDVGQNIKVASDAKRGDSAYDARNSLMSSAHECAQFDNQSVRLAQQAISSQVGAKLLDQCKQATSPTANVDSFANPDCTTPASQSTAFCQALCTQASAASNPQCAGFPGLNSGKNGLYGNADGATGKGTSDTASSHFGLLDEAEKARQNANEANIAPVGNKSSTAMGAGGLSGLGGPGGGAEGSAQAPGAPGGEGYKTNIDRGLASGNGYSAVGGVLRTGSNSGFSGYGTTSSAITNAGKPFNLKDFLPDAGKNAKLAALARSIASPVDISPSHVDIFKKVTDRFYQICLRDGLYDCAALNKHKMGN